MIDCLTDHEAFLRAVYDDPDDDTTRLVYADFLEENGEPERAGLIREQCERARRPRSVPVPPVTGHAGKAREVRVRVQLVVAWPPASYPAGEYERGFPRPERFVRVPGDLLNDPVVFREWTVRKHPEYFGAVEVRVATGPLESARQFETLLAAPALARVRRLDLRGEPRWVAGAGQRDPGVRSVIAERRTDPVVTLSGVLALAGCPAASRLKELDLTLNGLDDAAARCLVESPYLQGVERLEVARGNRISAGWWQRLIDRFGPAAT